MTAMPGQRDFPGGTGKKTPLGSGIEAQGIKWGRLQAATVNGIGTVVVGASADYVNDQEGVSVDDEKLFELGVLRPKKSIDDVCLGEELSREQQNEIMSKILLIFLVKLA